MTIKNNTMIKFSLKKVMVAILFFAFPLIMMGAETSGNAAASSINIDVNLVLLIVASLLLFPFYFSSKTFLFTLKDSLRKKMDAAKDLKKIAPIILAMFFSQVLMAQTAAAAAPQNEPIANFKNWITLILVVIIALEFLFIIYFSWKTTKLVNPDPISSAEVEDIETESAFEKFWNKINNFKSKGEEDTIDTGHNYDGIRELDNITPPWFVMGFVFSIIFAAVYLYRYHVAESAPLQIEEYNIEMAAADAEKALKEAQSPTNTINESNVVMLGAADIAKGKMFFTANCVSCHGANAASMAGGVGPNLTDEYWIHGGSISNVFKSINDGWPEKGMISWKSQLNSQQIAQIASYVLSVKGTVSSGGKEPQGELYKENVVVNDSSVIAKDTMLVVK